MLIIDTMYLLPLIGIGVNKDLLRAIVEGRARAAGLKCPLLLVIHGDRLEA